jgi:hypothetical protein
MFTYIACGAGRCAQHDTSWLRHPPHFQVQKWGGKAILVMVLPFDFMFFRKMFTCAACGTGRCTQQDGLMEPISEYEITSPCKERRVRNDNVF